MTKKRSLLSKKKSNQPTKKGTLLRDLRSLIEQARQNVATAINSSLTALYWKIGHRIQLEILQNKRAEYGQSIVASLARQLAKDYGSGFSEKYLRKMIQFAEVFCDERIVASLMRQLTWTHFTLLIPIRDPLKRDLLLPLP